MPETPELKLRVGELTERNDFGRGIVRIAAKDMKQIGVTEGDVIEVEGKRKTSAVVVRAYPVDVGLDVIRMDGLCRRNCGAGIGELVKARKADVKEAKQVTIAPARKGIIIHMGNNLLKHNMLMRPIMTGDIIIPNPIVQDRKSQTTLFEQFFGMDFGDFLFTPFGEEKFVVVSTEPKGIVRITRATDVELLPQATKPVEEDKIPEVTYEDLGGLHEEIKKVREMIELPLKHPEVFERLGIEPPKGILLHGPPGTGKTLLAKAVANESGAKFFVINGPEVMCVDGQTEVRTTKGIKTAKSLYEEIAKNGKITERQQNLEVAVPEKDFFVYAADEKNKIVEDRIHHAFKLNAEIYKVKLSNGAEVRASHNQPLLIKKENANEWVPLRELNGNEQAAVVGKDGIEFANIEHIEQLGQGEVFDFAINPYSNFIGGNPAVVLLHNSKFYGESEENLRKVFEQAEKSAPSIVFIDEIDSIAPKREEVKGEVEKRVVSQLLTLLDGLKSRGKVIIIGATNIPNSLDPALRRPGRFDREIELGVPNKAGRKEILQIHTRGMPLDKRVDIDKIAEITYGYVGADITALCKEAAMYALRRILPSLNEIKEDKPIPTDILKRLIVTKEDFDHALKMVEPSAMREVLIEVPNVKWEDVGGLADVKKQLKETIEWPLKYPDSFKRLGIRPPTGVMLYGPPGCGKTMLAKAVAHESSSNFISIKGPELLSMWVGESERHIRDIFRRAKQVAPAIIFFDEVDALVPRRGMAQSDHVSERVVSQMLAEISGLEELNDIVVIAATNRPDIMDPALLRPGRFDRQILVPTPDEEARLAVLKVHTKDMPVDTDVDLRRLAKETQGYSGADLEALAREAGLNAMRKNVDADKVTARDFVQALKEVKPSVTQEMNEFYASMMKRKKSQVMEDEVSVYTG